ncbi:ATP-binding cassette sub-family D member 3 [Agrilus planipennis]|uniref:ATP-binding cassette sub-family D member 3 n=1 Tax=Agrilus planipennis TaxID=224129 RepID=A0A7F5RC12_AGRPL|nr:ATP-binding cassette sub-family D member 3 [Agrilus planipennis]
MAPNFSKYLTRQNALSAAACAGILWYLSARQRLKLNKLDRRKIRKKIDEDVKYLIAEKTAPSTKAHVDRKFFSQLFQLLKIIIPGWTSSESGLLFLVAASLVARSLCDLWMISNGTKIESAIIALDKELFHKRLFHFLLAMPLVAVVNNVLKYSVRTKYSIPTQAESESDKLPQIGYLFNDFNKLAIRMAPNFSKYLTRQNALSAAACAGILWYLSARQRLKLNKLDRRKIRKKIDEDVKYLIAEKTAPSTKAHIDRKFFSQLFQLLKIIIPGWTSSESGLLFLVAASLVARSLCDLWMISNGTKIESAIIALDKELFHKRLFHFLLAMPLVAVVNNVLKYSVGELKIRLRNNMTRRLYDDYLKQFTYYRMTNLDNRISNADQLLTTDIDKFCESVADLYCNIAKPTLDIGIYVYRLTTSLGGGTPSIMLCYLVVSGFLLTYLRRPTGRLTATEQKLEGEFRHINSRLITHSEEIAFYQGNNREKATLLSSFNKLLAHLRKFLKFRVFMGIIDNMIAKYLATIIGFWAVSIPFVSRTQNLHNFDGGERSRLYYTYGRMLVKLAEAIGRLVLAGRELTRLAGFTTRVTQLRQVLADLNEGKYQRTMLTGTENLKLNSGKLIFKDNVIKFDKVPVITPNGDVLIKELSVDIHSGMNVLVCGPNGAGKSSVFRILGELWPLFGGELTKPPRGKLFYIPQKPYMTLGCLRDQIIYPHSGAEAMRRGTTDAKLMEHMKRVQLEYLLEREGGLDAVADWLDVLSGGEKQRIAMARLFYHAPQFAILDECTSAVSVDVEGSMYSYCREVGITLLTVSHRKSLWQHHEYVLHLDGRGSYTFKKIDPLEEQFGS